MTEHARTGRPHEPRGEDSIAVRLPREEVEALLLAVDALQPLLDRLRAQIAPVAAEASATASPVVPADDDALQRVTRLARQSLEEARLIVGERRITLSSGRRGRTQPDATGRPLGAQSGPSGRMIAPDECPPIP